MRPGIASSSRLDLASQAPCARPMLLLGQAPSFARLSTAIKRLAQDASGFFDEWGGLHSIATGYFGSGETFLFFQMLMPGGDWSLNFEPVLDENGNPARRFVSGSFSGSAPEPPTPTPEPGTFGTLLAGSAAIKWITRRRRKFRDAWPAR